jgi:hypothetical protein
MLRGPVNLSSWHLCDIGVLANVRFALPVIRPKSAFDAKRTGLVEISRFNSSFAST